MSCRSCITGHRTNHCRDSDRPLYAIKNKGRGEGTSCLPRSSQQPDFPHGVTDPAVRIFYQNMMNNSKLYKEYYHDSEPSTPSPCSQTMPCPRTQKKSGKRVDDMYGGTLSPEQVALWRELCGLAPMTTPLFPDSGTAAPQMHQMSPTAILETTVSVRDPGYTDTQRSPVTEYVPSRDNFNIPEGFIKGVNSHEISGTPSNITSAAIDVAEAQRRHPNIVLPTAWTPEVQEAAEEISAHKLSTWPGFAGRVEDENLFAFVALGH